MAQKVTDFYDKALKPAGISLNQYSLLVNLGGIEGCGTGELAQRVKLEKSTLVRTLQPLLRDGLVVDRSPVGSRRRQLYLTPLGRKVMKKAFPLWTKAQEDTAANLGKSLDELMTLFENIELWK